MAQARGSTVTRILTLLSVEIETLQQASEDSIDAEFRVIKKAYFKAILKSHPDKGGDPNDFREIQAGWEVLREFFEKKLVKSFAGGAGATSTARTFEAKTREFDASTLPPKSWEYYAEAEAADVPIYHVEAARSGRSKCSQKGKNFKKCADATIAEGALRVGSVLEQTGTYGHWTHIDCWRVPSKVWEGLPDPDLTQDPAQFAYALEGMSEVLFSGFFSLSKPHKARLVAHVMNKEHWTAKRKSAMLRDAFEDEHERAAAAAQGQMQGQRQGQRQGHEMRSMTEVVDLSVDDIDNSEFRPSSSSSSSSSSGGSAMGTATSLISVRPRFEIPRPGIDGPANSLQGKTIVLTGTFPEVGGGSGLGLGKEVVSEMLSSFGAKVTGSVSGKTAFLLVGKDAGAHKVGAARAKGITLVNLKDMADGLRSGVIGWDHQPEMVIEQFSAGLVRNGVGNSIVNRMSDEERVFVSGGLLNPTVAPIAPRQIDDSSFVPKKPRARAPKAAKAERTAKPALPKAGCIHCKKILSVLKSGLLRKHNCV